MENTTVSFDLSPTNQPLHIQVRFDQQIIFDQLVNQHVQIRHEFDDSIDQEHTLEIELQGKTPEHTRIDHQDNIIEDSTIRVDDMALDDIPLGFLAIETATYTHNNNGNSEQVSVPFYLNMGCNGVAQLKFTSPVYLWLLEKNKY